MTLTLPTIANTNYGLTNAAFRNAKGDRSGAVRQENFTVAVPSGTASTTIIGLVPFQKNFSLNLKASSVEAGVLDTGSTITIDFGYTYYDSTLGSSVDNAFVSAATTWQSSGVAALTFLGTESVTNWVAAADGWLTITLDAGPTTTTGNIFGKIVGAYDVGG